MELIWIITGDRQAGKTTFCQQWIDIARKAGWEVSGLLSPAEFIDGLKAAIWVEDLRFGERRLLASLMPTPGLEVRIGKWYFSGQVMEWGNEALKRSSPCDLLVIDELGPLEFDRLEGWQAGLTLVSKGDYQLALIVIRPEYLSQARKLWPSAKTIRID